MNELELQMGRSIEIPGFNPQRLGIEPADPIMDRFAVIHAHFAGLALPLSVLPEPQKHHILKRHNLPLGRPEDEDTFFPPDFTYGVDYFFGKYQGSPRSVRENAAAAIYHGRTGVEIWRIMKSVAFATPHDPLVVVHLRGDRTIDKFALCEVLGIQISDLQRADIKTQGIVEYGTVNPFLTGVNSKARHIFDSDLVIGDDYPDDDTVFTSSGDVRFYVGFDIRRYLISHFNFEWPSRFMPSVSLQESNLPRSVARRPVVVIGGDSGIDTANFGQTIMSKIIEVLKEKRQYFGDRSLPRLELSSDPKIAGSIDTGIYGVVLRKYIGQVKERLIQASATQRRTPIVTFSSMAMHGIAGDMLRNVDVIEYLGPREVVTQKLEELKEQDVDVANTILLGLPSAYDREVSAFSGEILDAALSVNNDIKQQIQNFVQECKTEEADPLKFYQIIEKILRNRVGDIDSLTGRNVVVVLGASELESFAKKFHKIPKTFEFIKPIDTNTIVRLIGNSSDSKIRLIVVSPIQSLAQVIAEKTLE